MKLNSCFGERLKNPTENGCWNCCFHSGIDCNYRDTDYPYQKGWQKALMEQMGRPLTEESLKLKVTWQEFHNACTEEILDEVLRYFGSACPIWKHDKKGIPNSVFIFR
jgi:hypothetical protein